MDLQIPEHTRAGLVVLSPTRVGLGARCQRKHTLADVVSWHKQGGGINWPLTFGERMHAAVAMRWRTNEVSAGTAVLRTFPFWEQDLGMHSSALAMSCYGAYVQSAKLMPLGSGEDGEWTLKACEERMVIKTKWSDVQFSFQLDRLLEHVPSNILALVDVKTARSCDARWARQWGQDLQMKLYSRGIREIYGRSPAHIIIEGLQKKPADYRLVVVPEFSPAIEDEAWRMFQWIARNDAELLDACTENGVVSAEKLITAALTQTPFSRAECWSYGAPCPYLGLCDAEPGERLGLLQAEFEYAEPEYV